MRVLFFLVSVCLVLVALAIGRSKPGYAATKPAYAAAKPGSSAAGQAKGEMSSKSAPPMQADRTAAPAAYSPAYTADGKLLAPAEYRQWIYLSSGLDMSYFPRVGSAADMSMFDNSFVNPSSWKSFQQTGTWPDKTMILLEVRGAHTKGSINKDGRFEGVDLMGLEVHLKDASHGGWAFYEFDGSDPAKMTPATMVPKDAACYSCHQAHAAVDTTFVQFYPTLLPVAKEKGTLSAAYLKDEAQP